MKNMPRISIVVPSYNQGKYLGETLQSLLDQEYANLQVIIQDGQSTDDSIAVAESYVQRHPDIFQLHVEKDSGQADAINRGFTRADGTILGFLNSDDTLFPGVFHRIAKEIDPASDRYIVMGRCLFTGENSRYVGVEHPAQYISHFDHLAIWRRGYNTIPQPSVFWHREVTDKIGFLDVNEHHALDYDLFCKFSRHYDFHRIDQLFSTYRMHDESKSSQRTEAEVLELTIGVSKKHWGSWLSPLRWRLELSHWAYTHQFHDHARHHARRAEEAFLQRRPMSAGYEFFRTFFYSPKMAWNRLFLGWCARRKLNALDKMVAYDTSNKEQYPDGWIGPLFIAHVDIPENASRIKYILDHTPNRKLRNFDIQLFINGTSVDRKQPNTTGSFELQADVSKWRSETISVELRSTSFFIPSKLIKGSKDHRRLSIKLTGHEIED
ncbi:MAG: glycosyltransferase [Xanthomonadaceae bacterium]|jgi:glycosyltransferase involved in cell wall biosynthesis|nr:glycosyltransferase [Xanthomonadaceae bacterium]